MAETTKKTTSARAAGTSATALAATTASHPTASAAESASYRGRGRGRSRGRGRGVSNRGGRSYNSQSPHPYIVFPNSWAASQWSSLMQANQPSWSSQDATTPCPYPSTPRPNSNSAGILGAAPDQAYIATLSPTDIQQALYALSLNQQDPHGFMDTGATGHMKIPQGSQDQGTPPTMQ
ncbi:hypothetical protein Hdeb2414_s0013g00410541 [Helianthus debilis subsp. tardiflorus]